jgi:hypothetical protein
MVDNLTSPLRTRLGLDVRHWKDQTGFSSQSEAPSECFSWRLHRLRGDMTLLLHQVCVALKRKSVAMGK